MKKALIFTFSDIILIAFFIKFVSPSSDYTDDLNDVDFFVSNEQNWKIGESKYTTNSDSTVIIKYLGFTILYNPNTKQPVWVDYTLTAEQVELTENTPEIKRRFMPDTCLSLPQATSEDYNKSGWVRGHMARRQDMKWSEQAVHESDYFTNICPQNGKMNNGIWHKIENLVRCMATQFDSVHIVCGPIFTDNSNGYIGSNRIPVPDYFFKAILVKEATGYHAIAFLCPNNADPIALRETFCTVDKVEILSNNDFFSYLPNKTEKNVERTLDTNWLNHCLK